MSSTTHRGGALACVQKSFGQFFYPQSSSSQTDLRQRPGAFRSRGLFWGGFLGTLLLTVKALAASGPPAVNNPGADNVKARTARLFGAVNPNLNSTTAHFEWGVTTNYGNATSLTNLGMSGGFFPIAAGLSNLSPATTYHFRLVASNAMGLTLGADQSFATLGPADLFSLVLSSGPLTPGFNPGPSNYSTTVSGGMTNVLFTPTAADPLATLRWRVNGGAFSTIPSGTSSPLALNFGTNLTELLVTAADGTTMKIYAVSIVRTLVVMFANTQRATLITGTGAGTNGQFIFTDPQRTNLPRRFFRVREM